MAAAARPASPPTARTRLLDAVGDEALKQVSGGVIIIDPPWAVTPPHPIGI